GFILSRRFLPKVGEICNRIEVSLTEDRLDEPAPFSPGNDETETVGSLLAGLAFHESYHCGQLGLLRRLLGKDGVIK
ncbi:DinB family protein, partial [bacterium]|nr:DinB family protein [bacterium]